MFVWAIPGVAQQLDAGMGIGFRTISTGYLDLDSIGVDITNPNDSRYLVPGITLSVEASKRITLAFDIQHQSGGISLRAYSLNADTCMLCPVKKGTLVSYREFLFGASAAFTLMEKKDWKFDLGGGIMYVIRYNAESSVTENLKNVGSGINQILKDSRSVAEKNYYNSRVFADIHWRRWSLSYHYLTSISPSVAGDIDTPGGLYSFNIDQRESIISLKFQLLTF